MEKNWLIRTKSNHILGPVSKEKVIELYNNGSIKQDDEICSGNGYWFFVREDDLVSRFVLGKELQGFNPISEAKDVLIAPINKPRYEPTRDDITLIGNVDLSGLKKSTPEATSTIKEVDSIAPKKKIKTEDTVRSSTISVPRKPLKKQSYLRYLAYVGFVLLCLLFYFRNRIIRSFFADFPDTSWSLISVAEAQEEATKKKSF
jgi:hypothetical protein